MTDAPSESRSSTPVVQAVSLDPEGFVREHIAWMLALSERLLRDPERAKDAVQDAFVSAFNGLESFEGRSGIKTWLHRITVNASLAQLRKTRQLAEESIDEWLPHFDELQCRVESPWNELASLQELLEQDEVRDRVKAAIDRLPQAYRIIVQLRDIEGYNTEEVATLLELTASNVKVRLHRARAALKKLLEPMLRGESE